MGFWNPDRVEGVTAPLFKEGDTGFTGISDERRVESYRESETKGDFWSRTLNPFKGFGIRVKSANVFR